MESQLTAEKDLSGEGFLYAGEQGKGEYPFVYDGGRGYLRYTASISEGRLAISLKAVYGGSHMAYDGIPYRDYIFACTDMQIEKKHIRLIAKAYLPDRDSDFYVRGPIKRAEEIGLILV